MGFISLRRAAAAILMLPFALGVPDGRADPLIIEGPADVVDNATIEIWGQRIRLTGITTPDPQSEEGVKGKRHLQDLLADIRVQCRLGAPISRSTVRGRCRAATVDLSDHLVRMGYAQAIADRPRPSRR